MSTLSHYVEEVDDTNAFNFIFKAVGGTPFTPSLSEHTLQPLREIILNRNHPKDTK